MSDCGVCLSGYDVDGYAEFYEVRTPKARKEHRCEDCNRTIAKGDVYHRVSGKFDGEFFDTITCAICIEIREAFTCDERDQSGPPPGELWADMVDVFPHLNSACFDKLRTAVAKAELQRRWMEWKGLTA